MHNKLIGQSIYTNQIAYYQYLLDFHIYHYQYLADIRYQCSAVQGCRDRLGGDRDCLGSGPGPCRGGEGLCRGGGGWRDGVAVLAGTVAVVGGTVAVRPGTVTVWPGSVTGWGSRPGYRGHAKTPSHTYTKTTCNIFDFYVFSKNINIYQNPTRTLSTLHRG